MAKTTKADLINDYLENSGIGDWIDDLSPDAHYDNLPAGTDSTVSFPDHENGNMHAVFLFDSDETAMSPAWVYRLRT